MITSDKLDYTSLCNTQTDIPIFSRDWWCEAICPGQWDVVVHRNQNEIIGAFPFYKTKKIGLSCILMPPFTQKMGPWIREDIRTDPQKEKKVLLSLIEQLPRYDYINIQLDYAYQNWLPFYWNNFKQTTKYTYVIENLNNLDTIFDSFSYAKKKNIKRAESLVTIKFDLDPKTFYENHLLTLKKQGRKIDYQFKSFKKIYDICKLNDAGRIIYAEDKAGNLHSALFVIWDKTSAYNLISTIDPDFRQSGAATLLVKEIIKYLAPKTKKFDFEGSIDRGISNSFSQFGTTQKSYHRVYKYNSILPKIILEIKQIQNLYR